MKNLKLTFFNIAIISFLFLPFCMGQKNDTSLIKNNSSSLEEVSFYLKGEGEITLWYYYPKKQFLYYQNNKKVCSFEQTQPPIFNWWLLDSLISLALFTATSMIGANKNTLVFIATLSFVAGMSNFLSCFFAMLLIGLFAPMFYVIIFMIIIGLITLSSYQYMLFSFGGIFSPIYKDINIVIKNIDKTVDNYQKNKYRYRFLYLYIALEIIFLSLMFYALS